MKTKTKQKQKKVVFKQKKQTGKDRHFQQTEDCKSKPMNMLNAVFPVLIAKDMLQIIRKASSKRLDFTARVGGFNCVQYRGRLLSQGPPTRTLSPPLYLMINDSVSTRLPSISEPFERLGGGGTTQWQTFPSIADLHALFSAELPPARCGVK